MLAAALMLGATSCKDDTFAEFGENNGDEVKVTFKISPEGAMAARSGSDEKHISDGTKADLLIYAVYDNDGNLLDDYGKGRGEDVPADKEVGLGQTAIMTTFPHELTMTLKKGETYKIAFWAQSSRTNAYNTADLKKVEVNYSEITDENSSTNPGSATPNNDEWRDAFCRVKEITTGSAGAIEENINLFRPLAQINVGTNGYDYEISTRETNTKYMYSRIRINRVARYLDVVADKTYTSTTENDENSSQKTPEAFAVVDFGWAPIPAYMPDEQGQYQLPEFPSHTVYDWRYNPDYVYTNGDKTLDKNNYESIYGNEEFLKVHYELPGADWTEKNEDDEFYPYANLNDNYDKDAEVFKYLSMCYVLTSSTEEEPVVINNVKMWLATDADGKDEIEVLNINHVPVQRNWRTNIIGNLLTEKNVFTIKLDKSFAGEYSGWGDTWKWTGPLASGVFYNGKDDVIEISSKEGLIWFQRMVNGNMLVRERTNQAYVDNVIDVGTTIQQATIGSKYPYYNPETRKTEYLEYEPVTPPTDKELLERILIATHQKYKPEGKNGWPENNQFHFCGDSVSGMATVRLMADIDLAGVEWIPIGMDSKQLDQANRWFYEGHAENRGFFGIFDGNGHTISNLTTRRFSTAVHASAQQKGNAIEGPYDNFQWMGRGLFGEIGGNAKIKNVRLYNVDILGCQGVGGIVGFAQGDKIEITNCIVDGGTIEGTPLYRGDSNTTGKDRSWARGVYVGGIVGYFHTQDGVVEGCEVRNVTVKGVRRVGGLIGSLVQRYLGDSSNQDSNMRSEYDDTHPKSISNNKLLSAIVIATSYNSYGMKAEANSSSPATAKGGFGYNEGTFIAYSNLWVGGHVSDLDGRTDIFDTKGTPTIHTGNVASGVTYSELTIRYDANKNERISIVHEIPLDQMPMLSSWFADNITLYSNYHGQAAARTRFNLHPYNFFSSETYADFKDNTTYNQRWNGRNVFYIPMNLPFDTSIDWVDDNTSGKAAMYVETVTLDGKEGIGGRSVITPTNVGNANDCVMYITARDRRQFVQRIVYFSQPTIVNNVVLRGDPYAYNGILLAPNRNMSDITLNNVAIYDVYKTIAMDDWTDQTDFLIFPNTYNSSSAGGYREDMFNSNMVNEITHSLNVNDCNLRGYTVPGSILNAVNYSGTTFERGANTGHGEDEYTCKVETNTTFKGCYFKAPYIIDLTALPAGKTVSFDDNCYATSSSAGSNVQIDLTGKTGCDKIVIDSDQGVPVVKYFNGTSELE